MEKMSLFDSKSSRVVYTADHLKAVNKRLESLRELERSLHSIMEADKNLEKMGLFTESASYSSLSINNIKEAIREEYNATLTVSSNLWGKLLDIPDDPTEEERAKVLEDRISVIATEETYFADDELKNRFARAFIGRVRSYDPHNDFDQDFLDDLVIGSKRNSIGEVTAEDIMVYYINFSRDCKLGLHDMLDIWKSCLTRAMQIVPVKYNFELGKCVATVKEYSYAY